MHFFLGSLYYVTNCPIVTPFLNNESILSIFFFVKIRFSESNIWWFYILFGLSIFWSIWNDSPCKTLVDVASKLWWFWTLLYISNFYITSGFTNVTWTRRTISFIDNTWFVRNKETKDRIFLVFHVISILKPLFVNL